MITENSKQSETLKTMFKRKAFNVNLCYLLLKHNEALKLLVLLFTILKNGTWQIKKLVKIF